MKRREDIYITAIYSFIPIHSTSHVTLPHHTTPPYLPTEPTGWNDILDQAWRAAVDQATCPTALMECVLLLEHYLNKAWLTVCV